MNQFASGSIKTPSGWIAFYRDVTWSKNRVLRDGRNDIIFNTEAEAKEAGHQALLRHLNGGMTGERMCPMSTSAKQAKFEAADRALFNKGKRIEVSHVGGDRP